MSEAQGQTRKGNDLGFRVFVYREDNKQTDRIGMYIDR